MTTSLLLAAVALQLMPAPTLDRWEPVHRNEGGDTAIDPQSIRRAGDVVTLFVRTRMHGGGPGGQAATGVIRYAYDCRAGTARMEAADIYAGGAFLGSEEEGSPIEPIPASSPNAAVRDRVCR